MNSERETRVSADAESLNPLDNLHVKEKELPAAPRQLEIKELRCIARAITKPPRLEKKRFNKGKSENTLGSTY